ncbi:MAG: type VI secretion system protein TssA [Burkholderiales bacterium]|nr:type VI secretion system protein TssA [Burkholderiales bacterium]
MDLETLLQPMAEGPPCGEDLSFSAEFDTIAELRREDDASLPLGEWKEKGKEPKVADWPALCALCETLLRERSKDLRLVGWLAEGWAHERGFGGLADGLALAAAMITRHWEGLHPLPEGGDHELRVGSLSWLLGRVAPLARQLVRAGAAAPSRIALAGALQALAQLQAAADARLGAEGPGFVGAREALKAVLADLPADAADPAAEPGPNAAGAAAPGAATSGAGPLQTRAQALQQLRQVAEFFRRTEPHSPVAYLADKAARWGTMDLHGWLRTVVKDGGSLAHLEELLGVEPPRPG